MSEPTSPAPGPVFIVSAFSQSSDEQQFKLTNAGDAELKLSAWHVPGPVGTTRFDFPEALALKPGESVTVHTKGGTNGGGNVFLNAGSSAASLWDPMNPQKSSIVLRANDASASVSYGIPKQ